MRRSVIGVGAAVMATAAMLCAGMPAIDLPHEVKPVKLQSRLVVRPEAFQSQSLNLHRTPLMKPKDICPSDLTDN